MYFCLHANNVQLSIYILFYGSIISTVSTTKKIQNAEISIYA